MIAALVSVVVDGTFVPAAPPASLSGGRVIAPLELVARIADRVESAGGIVTARRGTRTCSARAIPASDPLQVVLAPLARCLGAAHVGWDGRTKTLSLAFAGGPVEVRTPVPFDPAAPQVAPTTIFTPEPGPATPRAIDTGSPRPRRTAIPIFVPVVATTTPRPRSL